MKPVSMVSNEGFHSLLSRIYENALLLFRPLSKLLLFPVPCVPLSGWCDLPWERSRRKIPGSNPACAGIFSGSSHTSDLKIGTPVATLPVAWCYRVSAGAGWPGVRILWLGEMESLVCNFYLSVACCCILRLLLCRLLLPCS